MAVTVERKYGALRAIAIIIKVLAILFLIFTVIGALSMMANSGGSAMAQGVEGMRAPGMLGGAFGGFLVLIWGILGTISLWAGAELICLLIDVEENTRKTHVLLERGRD
jgi:L-asparagine transporter-like permease